MPYARNSELPEPIRNVLPEEAQTLFRNVVNSVLESNPNDEELAFATAWSALKDAGWEKDPETGRWRKIEKRATTFRDLPLAPRDYDWDAGVAEGRIRKWASSDSSGEKDTIDWEKYGQAFFWYDADNPENFGSYKLPFGDIIDGRLMAVPRAVFAAAGVMQGAMGGVDIPSEDVEPVKNHIARYYAKMREEWGDDNVIVPWERVNKSDNSFEYRSNIVKVNQEERIVTGVVLKPNEEDLQGDIVSEEEIRKAMFSFMEWFGTIGYMHKDYNRNLKLIENYQAPQDLTFTVGDETVVVKKGTWLMTVKVNDDEIWEKVKAGEITGFSVKGYGVRTPV